MLGLCIGVDDATTAVVVVVCAGIAAVVMADCAGIASAGDGRELLLLLGQLLD